MINVYDRDHPRLVIDPVDDPVAAASSAVPIVQWCQETSAHTVRIVQRRAVDELERGKGNRFGKPLSQRSPNGGRDAQREALRRPVIHAECRRRATIDSANSSAPTTSPRASSASESTKRHRVAGSDSTRDQHGRRSAMHRHRDSFVMSVDPPHQLRVVRLHIGERHCRHGQKYD